MTTDTHTNTADGLVAGFAAWASPRLSDIANLTEAIARTLNTRSEVANGEVNAELVRYQRADAQGRAQLYPSLRTIAPQKIQRERTSMDLGDLVRDAERSMSRWVNRERQRAEVARAAPPATDDPTELARRADLATRASDLSHLPPETMLAEAQRLLDEGDPVEADVRLRAAIGGGRLRATAPGSTYGVLRRATDDALDRANPHRAEASSIATEATQAYRRAMTAVGEFADASRALMNAAPTDPSAEIEAARALVARYRS